MFSDTCVQPSASHSCASPTCCPTPKPATDTRLSRPIVAGSRPTSPAAPRRTSSPTSSTTLDLLLHYEDLLETLGIEQVSVAGISVGAWIGAELAAILRRRVDKLVLINPLGIWDEANPGEDFFAQSPAAPMGVQFSDPGLRKSLLVEGRDGLEAMLQEALDLRATANFLWPIVSIYLGRRASRPEGSRAPRGGSRNFRIAWFVSSGFSCWIQ